MSDSSIKSGIQLESYKLDKVSLNVVQEVGILSKKSHSNCEIKYQFSFRDALRLKNQNGFSYVTGLRLTLTIFDKDLNRDIADGEFIITGLFSATGEFDSKTEENIIKIQAPAILFPYMRAAITLLLNTAGFSTIIMPLVNVAAMSKTLSIKINDANMKAE